MLLTASAEITPVSADIGVPLSIGFFTLIAVIIFFVVRRNRKIKKQRVQYLSENGYLETTRCYHLEGLPIAERTICEIFLKKERLVISGGGASFNIEIKRITAAENMTDVEIANVVHSSAVKGVAGGLLFGPIGLVVGSRATNKEKRTLKRYFVVNYVNSSGDLASILFEDSLQTDDTQKLGKMIKEKIKDNHPKEITL